jgi:hypothetical protein
MSLSTIKRSVVWIDNERKAVKEAQKSRLQNGEPPSPKPWIEVRSEASTVQYDGISLSSVDNYTFASETASSFTPAFTFERSAGYDYGQRRYYDSTPGRNEPDQGSVAAKSAAAHESQVVYPGTFRLLLITLSIAISLFLVALDRTIVSTAM